MRYLRRQFETVSWWRALSKNWIKTLFAEQPVGLMTPFTLLWTQKQALITGRTAYWNKVHAECEVTFISISPLSSSSNDPAWTRMSAVHWDMWILRAVDMTCSKLTPHLGSCHSQFCVVLNKLHKVDIECPHRSFDWLVISTTFFVLVWPVVNICWLVNTMCSCGWMSAAYWGWR